MRSENHVKTAIREMFISQDGDKFLNLSEKDQENLIEAILIGYINRKNHQIKNDI